VPDREADLSAPGLNVNVTDAPAPGSYTLEVTAADSLARFVQISLDGYDAVFSDNCFDVAPGHPVTLTMTLPSGTDLADVKAGIRAKCLNDVPPTDKATAMLLRLKFHLKPMNLVTSAVMSLVG
jgi:beta-mannosidase